MPTPSLPPEILDYIIDFLHDKPETLKQCCLAAKSLIPRTRKHLFADIGFRFTSNFNAWKKAFPDSSNSPAHYARTLFVGCVQDDMMAKAEETGWTRTFSGVTNLRLDNHSGYIHQRVSLVPFHSFSPTLRSLHVHSLLLPSRKLFTLVLSSPLLEDLTVKGTYAGRSGNHADPHELGTAILSTPPPLTGTLGLDIAGGMEDTVRTLLDLPNGPHFQKLRFWRARNQDVQWMMKLLTRCSDNLESLCVRSHSPPYLEPEASIDLSKATRLKGVDFRAESWLVGWISVALRTITPEHRDLREISIFVHYTLAGSDIRGTMGEAGFGWWLDLDRILVRLWESHSVHPGIRHERMGGGRQDTEYCIKCLLPEAAKRGIIDLI